MRKILTTLSNEPILEIVDGVSAGKTVKFGVFRDRVPDSGWGELRQCNLELVDTKELDFNETSSQRLIEDLAFAYGRDTKKFQKRMEEMQLFCIGIEDFNFLMHHKMQLEEKKRSEYYKRNLDRVLKVIAKKQGEGYVKDILELMEESCATGEFRITKEPTGERQEENYDYLCYSWVSQSCGIAGDDYYGTFFVEICQGRYLELNFQM